ncbi:MULTISPECIES: putative nucleotidyltransferase substrate binding domain-containing protein [Alteromonas]|uniref:Signaling protein n=1 Tax=Alteromonas macleodii (strain English Channel 673) TaxID=1004788 RepID=A0AB33A2R5_ALTME|nr:MULTISPECIES: putative nucleotidyltransferase substrate binding domain-containing protein [Alteromonas]MEC8746753.1 putative nucleotidyltransferase substrate binding domain-containing protein [Pseudomonadota bacterium]NKX32426.1 CBS domain-containing protein [Alteromonadaceae bacterium A_SAG1]AFT76007.1 Signaling protein [Alteromonas macleodii str. 'English Channel 673']MBL3812090.1 CBS domain-containing protein [Alteromonas macleodii]MBL3885565.1 CBS domain-containing protein [Alteromonas 
MTAMAKQVEDFLNTSAPFDVLDKEQKLELVKHTELIYLTADNVGDLQKGKSSLFLIQNGQFSVQDSDAPLRHLSEGDYFGYTNIMEKRNFSLSISVDSPGLVYCFEASAVTPLFELPAIRNFFDGLRNNALQNHAISDSNSMWLYKGLEDVINKSPVSVDIETSITVAAQIMTNQKVSSLLVTREDKLIGIITDRDLRSRVVAASLDIHLPVSHIMTPNPAQIMGNRTLFDALALMTERNIHHLPVIDQQTLVPLGMVTASDIIRHQRGNVLFIIGELSKAENLYELTRLSWQLPHYFSAHAKKAGDYDIAGKILSQATDIMTRKLIGFFQQANGKAPMMFAWLVYGSQAREDQTMGSDQDNGLLLTERPSKTQAEYFAKMADYVCNGLAKCGIKLCDGNIMASNPKLRLSLEEAIEEAKRWVKAPTKDAIMHFNIFLDVRCAAGDISLFKQLQRQRAPLMKQNMFLAALTRNSNEISVPLSMFQKFIYEKGRKEKDVIDLKTRAVALINNIARIYALADGVTLPNTLARLDALSENSQLSKRDATNLRDIWLFLNRLRWRHQLENKVTDNRVSVSSLSSIEKHQLKAAFKAIERTNQAMVMKFSGGVS